MPDSHKNVIIVWRIWSKRLNLFNKFLIKNNSEPSHMGIKGKMKGSQAEPDNYTISNMTLTIRLINKMNL